MEAIFDHAFAHVDLSAFWCSQALSNAHAVVSMASANSLRAGARLRLGSGSKTEMVVDVVRGEFLVHADRDAQRC